MLVIIRSRVRGMLVNIFKQISRKKKPQANRKTKTKQKPTQKSKFKFVALAGFGSVNVLMGVDFKLPAWGYHRATSLLPRRS